MNFKSLFENYYAQLLVVAVLAAVFIYPPQAVLQNDLDSAVRWASDYLFEIGNPNLLLYPHTNGPLFFLKFPNSEGYSILLTVLFDLFAKFILGWYVLKLTRQFHDSATLAFAVVISFYVFLSFDFIIIAAVLAACLLALNSKETYSLLPGVLLAVISIYIKASISFPCLFILGSTFLVLAFRKEFKRWLILFLSASILFILLTTIIYGFGLHGFVWIFNSLIKTLGYGSDQAIYFNNFLPYILLSVLFIALPLVVIRNKETKELFLISALALFAVWKYSLGRQDFVHYQAWLLVCIVLAGFVVLINKKHLAIIGLSCYLLSAGFFITNTKRTDAAKQFVINTPRFDYLPRVLFQHKTINEEFNKQSLFNLRNDTISDSILNIIGNKTVDVFPWGLAVLSKYELNYKPRNNFHSTILGNSADAHEGQYFASKEGPEYILWHESQKNAYSFNGHNQVYLPNAAPHAIHNLASNYEFVRADGDYSLWKKNRSWAITMHKGTYPKNVKFNQWFKAPKFDRRCIKGNIDFKLSVLDKLRSFLYKGRFFKIAYKLKDGEIINHFVSLHSLQNNFLLQPYFTNPSLDYKVVDSILIKPMADKYRNKKVDLAYWNSL